MSANDIFMKCITGLLFQYLIQKMYTKCLYGLSDFKVLKINYVDLKKNDP